MEDRSYWDTEYRRIAKQLGIDVVALGDVHGHAEIANIVDKLSKGAEVVNRDDDYSDYVLPKSPALDAVKKLVSDAAWAMEDFEKRFEEIGLAKIGLKKQFSHDFRFQGLPQLNAREGIYLAIWQSLMKSLGGTANVDDPHYMNSMCDTAKWSARRAVREDSYQHPGKTYQPKTADRWIDEWNKLVAPMEQDFTRFLTYCATDKERKIVEATYYNQNEPFIARAVKAELGSDPRTVSDVIERVAKRWFMTNELWKLAEVCESKQECKVIDTTLDLHSDAAAWGDDADRDDLMGGVAIKTRCARRTVARTWDRLIERRDAVDWDAWKVEREKLREQVKEMQRKWDEANYSLAS